MYFIFFNFLTQLAILLIQENYKHFIKNVKFILKSKNPYLYTYNPNLYNNKNVWCTMNCHLIRAFKGYLLIKSSLKKNIFLSAILVNW